MSLPHFTGEDGILREIEPILGRPDLLGPDKWRQLILGESRTGVEFENAWQQLSSQGVQCCNFLEATLTGPLTSPVFSAGENSTDGSTKTLIVKSLETLHLRSLVKALELYPDRNARPVRFFTQRDKLSQAWLSALPSPLSLIPGPEFSQAMAWSLMVPSPYCQQHHWTNLAKF